MYMNTAIINFTTEPHIKKEAQKVARELGIPLSLVLNNYLKQFIHNKRVVFQEEIPNKQLISVLKQAEENYKNGNTSPVLRNAKEAIAYLEEQGI